jgi:hypothetical protein
MWADGVTTDLAGIEVPAKRGPEGVVETVGKSLKKLVDAYPEIAIDPTFTADADGNLVFRDGVKLTLPAAVFGIDKAKLTPGQKIRMDLKSFGLSPAKYIKAVEKLAKGGYGNKPPAWAKKIRAFSLPKPTGALPEGVTRKARKGTGGTEVYGGLPLFPPGPAHEAISKAADAVGRQWRRMVTYPAHVLNSLAPESALGRLRDVGVTQLSDTYGRDPEWIQSRREAAGGTRLTRFTADRLAKEYTKTAKAAQIDPADVEFQYQVEQVLRGRLDPAQLSPSIRAWVEQVRTLQDAESMRAADIYESLGRMDKATTYRQNVGKYLKNIPIESVTLRGKTRAFIGRLLGPRLSKAFDKIKHDKWILRVDNSFRKFETQEEAEAAYVNAVNEKKLKLFTKRAQGKQWTLEREGFVPTRSGDRVAWKKTEEGIGPEPSDLYRQAAKRITLIEPIPEEWRKENEIHNPAYLFAMSVVETRHDADMALLFKKASDKWGQRAPEGMTEKEVETWAEANGLKQLPKTKRLGELSDLYVPRLIADDLTEMDRLPSALGRIYQVYLGAWKSSKTIYNPSTHVRNVLGNFTFSYLARTSPWNPSNMPHYLTAAKELIARGADYEALVKEGVLGTEYFGAELKAIERSLTSGRPGAFAKALGMLKAVHNTVGEVYAVEDQIFKMAAYKKYLAEGMEQVEAAKEVNKWFPNYSETSRLTRWLKQSPVGAPFISFVDQSVRIGGRAFVDRPLRLAMIAALPGAISYLSTLILGIPPDEKQLLDAGRSYFEPITPFRDKGGRAYTVDLRYIMPLANDLLWEDEAGPVSVPWLGSNPVLSTGMELAMGRERFTGRVFAREDQTSSERWLERLKVAGKNLAPIPTSLQWGPRRISGAIEGTRREEVSLALLGVLVGINVRNPWIAERKVKQLVQRVALDDPEQAKSIIELWNTKYKPADWRPLSGSLLVPVEDTKADSARERAMDQAIKMLAAKNDTGAAEEVEKYLREHPDGRYLSMADVELRQAELGKTDDIDEGVKSGIKALWKRVIPAIYENVANDRKGDKDKHYERVYAEAARLGISREQAYKLEVKARHDIKSNLTTRYRAALKDGRKAAAARYLKIKQAMP